MNACREAAPTSLECSGVVLASRASGDVSLLKLALSDGSEASTLADAGDWAVGERVTVRYAPVLADRPCIVEILRA